MVMGQSPRFFKTILHYRDAHVHHLSRGEILNRLRCTRPCSTPKEASSRRRHPCSRQASQPSTSLLKKSPTTHRSTTAAEQTIKAKGLRTTNVRLEESDAVPSEEDVDAVAARQPAPRLGGRAARQGGAREDQAAAAGTRARVRGRASAETSSTWSGRRQDRPSAPVVDVAGKFARSVCGFGR